MTSIFSNMLRQRKRGDMSYSSTSPEVSVLKVEILCKLWCTWSSCISTESNLEVWGVITGFTQLRCLYKDRTARKALSGLLELQIFWVVIRAWDFIIGTFLKFARRWVKPWGGGDKQTMGIGYLLPNDFDYCYQIYFCCNLQQFGLIFFPSFVYLFSGFSLKLARPRGNLVPKNRDIYICRYIYYIFYTYYLIIF